MKIELVTERHHLDALASRWDQLALADRRDGFFRTSGWYRSWLEHIRPEATPFVILARDSEDTIVGLAPLCRLHFSDLGFRLSCLSWAGRDVVSGDFLDVLAEAQNKARVTSAFLKFLVEVRSQWSLIVIGELLDGGESEQAINQLSKAHGFRLRRQEERTCPFIELPSTFEQYLQGLGRSSRYNIRRRIREATEKNKAVVKIYSQPAEVAAHLDTLIQLHLARWKRENLPGTLGRPGFAQFLRKVSASLPEKSACRLYLLVHKDSPTAAILMFYFGCSAIYYQAGWDPDSALAAHSPALVLMARTIQDAIEEGYQYYEFLRGSEAYKARWTKTYRTTSTVLIANSLWAKGYLGTAHLKDRLKRFLLSKESPSAQAGEASGEHENAGALTCSAKGAWEARQ